MDKEGRRMHLSIVTGASKGLGAAIAEGLLQKGHIVHAVSRTKSEVSHERLIRHEADLTQLAETEKWFRQLTESVQARDFTSITLINNAGMVTPIKRAGEAEPEELRLHYDLNLLAPVILSQLFTKWLKPYKGKNRLSIYHQVRPKTLIKDGAPTAVQKRGSICSRKHSALNRKINLIR